MSADYDRTEIAETLLESGRDRIPRIPDKRRIKVLRLRGLIQYPDGYSLTANGMMGAVQDWSSAAREAEKAGNIERAAELKALAKKGEVWAAKHNITPDVQKLRFGDLPFMAYHTLWELVTDRGREDKDSLRKNDLALLLKLGYIQEDARIKSIIVPTPKGTALAQEYGNPFLGLGTATKVAARFTLAKTP